MTIPLPQLKKVKNAVIGNPLKKAEVARDEVFVRTLIQSLLPPTPPTNRTESAHILASLAYSDSSLTLTTLLRLGAHNTLLFSLSRLSPSDPTSLGLALARALRALMCAAADVLGPALWGIRVVKGKGEGVGEGEEMERDRAGDAIDYLFQIQSLDTLLSHLFPSPTPSHSYTPSHSPSSPSPIKPHILSLLAHCTRTTQQRLALTTWSPPHERVKEVRAKRGWEVASGPGWVVKELVRCVKVVGEGVGGGMNGGAGGKGAGEIVEVLGLLGALCKDPSVAGVVMKHEHGAGLTHAHGKAPAEYILEMAKGRNVDVQIAACLCLTHALRATLTTPPTTAPTQALEDLCVRTVINVVGAIIKDSSESGGRGGGGGGGGEVRKRACFVLYYLATDHPMICRAMLEHGCVESLVGLVKSITPEEIAEVGEEEMWEGEGVGVAELREAALTTLATLSLRDNAPRTLLTSPEHNILPILTVSLTHPHAGVRTASCQVARALSRAVEPLRTSVIDSGVGMRVWEVVLKEWGGEENGVGKVKEKEGGKEGGDKRVLSAGLAVVCNIVNDFSPLREMMLEQNFVPRLMQIFHWASPQDVVIRVNCLWAIMNLVVKCTIETRREIMECVGWDVVSSLLTDTETQIQEQAFHILHNLASDEDGVDLVVEEIGADVVLDRITTVLGGSDDEVIVQATSLLANISNGTEQHKHSILTHPRLLSALRSCIAESKPEARKRAVACVAALAEHSTGEDKRRMLDAGLGNTLKHICEWSNVGVAAPLSMSMSPSSPTAPSPLSRRRRNSSVARSTGMVRSVSGGHGVGVVVGHQWRVGVAHAHGGNAGGVQGGGGNSAMEDDRDIVGPARRALEWLEHGDSYSF